MTNEDPAIAVVEAALDYYWFGMNIDDVTTEEETVVKALRTANLLVPLDHEVTVEHDGNKTRVIFTSPWIDVSTSGSESER